MPTGTIIKRRLSSHSTTSLLLADGSSEVPMSTFGGTITSGIQDISALLPLLGTDQCEKHIVSALDDDKGFLYVAAAPISLFGSLGIVKAGFKALLASLSIKCLRFLGARKLDDAGLAPDADAFLKGNVLSMLTLVKGRFVAETRLESMLSDLHIEDVAKVSISWDCWRWNIHMVFSCALLSLLSITPYIYLIHSGIREPPYPFWATWGFPLIRIMGGYLTAILVQLVIQFRVLNIIKKRLLLMQCNGHISKLDPAFNFEMSLDECWWELQRLLGVRSRSAFRMDRPDRQEEYGLEGQTGIPAPPNGARTLPSTTQVPPRPSELREARGQIRKHIAELFLGKYFSRQLWLYGCQLGIAIGLCLSIIGYIGCFNLVQRSSRSAGALSWLAAELTLSLLRIFLWASNPNFDNNTSVAFTLQLNPHPPPVTCDKFCEDLDEEKRFPAVRGREFLRDVTQFTGVLLPFASEHVSFYYAMTRSEQYSYKRALYVVVFDYRERVSLVASFLEGDQSVHFFGASLQFNPHNNDIISVTMRDEIESHSNHISRDKHFRENLIVHCQSIITQLSIRHRGESTMIASWTLNQRPWKPISSSAIQSAIDWLYLVHSKLERTRKLYGHERGRRISGIIKDATELWNGPRHGRDDIIWRCESHLRDAMLTAMAEAMEFIWVEEVRILEMVICPLRQKVISKMENVLKGYDMAGARRPIHNIVSSTTRRAWEEEGNTARRLIQRGYDSGWTRREASFAVPEPPFQPLLLPVPLPAPPPTTQPMIPPLSLSRPTSLPSLSPSSSPLLSPSSSPPLSPLSLTSPLLELPPMIPSSSSPSPVSLPSPSLVLPPMIPPSPSLSPAPQLASQSVTPEILDPISYPPVIPPVIPAYYVPQPSLQPMTSPTVPSVFYTRQPPFQPMLQPSAPPPRSRYEVELIWRDCNTAAKKDLQNAWEGIGTTQTNVDVDSLARIHAYGAQPETRSETWKTLVQDPVPEGGRGTNLAASSLLDAQSEPFAVMADKMVNHVVGNLDQDMSTILGLGRRLVVEELGGGVVSTRRLKEVEALAQRGRALVIELIYAEQQRVELMLKKVICVLRPDDDGVEDPPGSVDYATAIAKFGEMRRMAEEPSEVLKPASSPTPAASHNK